MFFPKPSARHAQCANLATQCEKADIPSLLYLPSDAQLVADSYSLVVDAIFGVGFEPPMSSDFAAIIQTISRSKVPVVSIDVPSGALLITRGPRRGRGVSVHWGLPRGLHQPKQTDLCFIAIIMAFRCARTHHIVM